MSSITTIMNTTLSALTAQQAAIAVTSNNIANADTDGYTRQEVVFSPTSSGVTVNTKRLYDTFLSKQIRTAEQELGKDEAELKYLNSIETVFTESSGAGLSTAMSDFWSTWEDLVNDPSDASVRSILASRADTLADTFNSMSSDLSDIREGIDDDVVDTVAAINEDIEQIADLNRKMALTSAAGQDVSAYQDSLDALVSDLSSLVNVSIYTNDSGQVCVELADGSALVEGTTVWSLSTQTSTTTGMQDVVWLDGSGNATVVNDCITGGELGGALEIRDVSIPAYQAELDTLASSIMTAVNTLHESGYDLYGDAGVSFFTGTGAVDMAVNSVIMDDAGKIAASASAGENDSENGQIAEAIAALQSTLTLDGGTSTFSDGYAALVSKVGAAVAAVETRYDAQSDTVALYTNLRDSASGVSLDEEQVRLLQYQTAYAAAAKVMTILDELLQTLIQM